MNEKVRYESPLLKLAIERKLITPDQYEQCRELVKKSKKIGLESTIEEVLVKQGFLREEELQELAELLQLAEKGDLFGGYRLQHLIGKGGMGKVYEAVHEFTGRRVALKVLNTSFTKDGTNVVRFFQEIRALAKLNSPYIVTLFDAGKAGRRYYFAMELINGPTLDRYVAEKKHLSESEALSITGKIARALSLSHAANVIHRDIKPENILIDEQRIPRVTDFGVVMHQGDDHLTLTQEGFMVGSVHFSSPEQVEGTRDIDGRSDIYSLGATLYFMLTGKTVYSGKSSEEILTKHLVGNWVSPRVHNPAVSKRTVRLVRKMMSRSREKRIQTMDEVAAEVNRITSRKHLRTLLAALVTSLLCIAAGAVAEHVLHLIDKLIIRFF